MIQRRQILQAGLAGASAIALGPFAPSSRAAEPIKIRYNEVVRSMFFAPAYAAISKGFFREAGIDVELSTANGGDKSMAALLGRNADIALLGPEVPIYVMNSESPEKVRMFCGMTATDGYLLVARERSPRFDWSSLRGKEVMGWRPGSTPLIFLETAIRQRGLDLRNDVKLVNNIAPPARMGAWLSGQTQYAIFSEPDASQLEIDGKGFVVASIGEIVGMVDYTVFGATASFIKANPGVIQAWTNVVAKAMKWTESAPTTELAAALAPFFPGTSAQAMNAGIERYRTLKIWKTVPSIAPSSLERFQDILVQSQALDAGKRVRFDSVVVTQFAEKAP